jgi:hypothetical protein
MSWLEWKIPMVAFVLALGGCADDDSKASSGADSSTGGDDRPATGGLDTTGGPAATGTDATSTTSEPGPTSTSSATSTSTSTSTTGEETYACNGWDENATEPFLELYDARGTLMQSGGTFAITCGGQGSWMFPIFPRMGGFRTTGYVTFAVTIDVEGFEGPMGQLFHLGTHGIEVLCTDGGDTFDGGFAHDCIAVLPPDMYLADLSVLDGALADVHVEMLDAADQPVVTVDLTDMVLSAPVRRVSEDCFF